MKLTFFTTDAEPVQLFPIYENLSGSNDVTEEENINRQLKFQGNLRFEGADYDYLKALTLNFLPVKVYKNDVFLLDAKIDLNSGSTDIDNKTCTLKIDSLQSTFIKKYDETQNLNYAQKNSVFLYVESRTLTFTLKTTEILDSLSAVALMNNLTGLSVAYSTYYEEESFHVWEFKMQISIYPMFEFESKINQNSNFILIYLNYQYNGSSYDATEPIEQIDSNIFYYLADNITRSLTQEYTNCIKLVNVLNYLLKKIDTNYSVDEINSNTDLSNIYVMQKSDAKRPNSTDKSWLFETNLKEFLEILRQQNSFRWYLYEDTLKIDFDPIVNTIDFTNFLGENWTEQLREYETPSGGIIGENWDFEASKDVVNFNKFDVFYSGEEGEKKKYSLQKVNNDLAYLAEDPSEAEDTGFTFVYAPYNNITERNEIYCTDKVVNQRFSRSGLWENYLRYNRPYKYSSEQTNPLTTTKRKKIKTFNVPYSDEFLSLEPKKAIHSASSDCEIQSIKIPLAYNSNTCEITLIF